ncbi:hypothetical protein JKF63_03407 [Porcisia hertigi]|uniref:Uncharacterized protein n=1 Tax=Porcisia hertigi TaxID=2761500 RepID=A0A836L9B0_9TRYP|nr:hypothetical protein JKF63_03407 [Porcisia hertigi]
MFAARDSNLVSIAPPVKIPTLSSPSDDGAVVKATAYSLSRSSGRRFPNTRLPGGFAAPAGASLLPVTEIRVHECGIEASSVVESPQCNEWGKGKSCGDDGRSYNERCQLEEPSGESGAALQTTSTDPFPVSPSVMGLGVLNIDTPADEVLLQKEEFVEQLLQQVRSSCAGLALERSASASGWEKETVSGAGNHRDSSSLPRRAPSLGVEFLDSTRNHSSDAGQRLTCISRLPNSSPMSDSLAVKRLTQPLATKAAHAQAETPVGRRVRETVSPGHRCPSVASPDPRPPSTDLYATGGALRSSLQHSRCSGVSRGRRSPSAERSDYCDAYAPLAAPVQETEEDKMAIFQRRSTGASTGTPRPAGLRSISGSCSESVHVELSRPQWKPCPIEVARPAWNQRQPPRKQRPVVSAPGSKPPSSARRCVSRSPEISTYAQGLRGLRSEEKDATGASHRSTERSLRRTASVPLQLLHERATAPPSAAGQALRATVASPSSPPSARALFQGHDAPGTSRTTLSLGQEREMALQGQCDAALERATRAERQCNLLSHALEQLLIAHAADKGAWEARHSALEQRLDSVVKWITGIDAEANLSAASQGPTNKPTPEMAALDTATPQLSNRRGEADDELCPVTMAATKITAWEEPVDALGITHNRAIHSTESSPVSCAPGATPTPARRNAANSDSGCASTCEVRLPPSPPLILRMHATATQ